MKNIYRNTVRTHWQGNTSHYSTIETLLEHTGKGIQVAIVIL